MQGASSDLVVNGVDDGQKPSADLLLAVSEALTTTEWSKGSMKMLAEY
jgi:hypothetical protein